MNVLVSGASLAGPSLAHWLARAGHVPALLDGVRAADDLYFDSVNQVHMPAWSRGRVTLVGDAGYCTSPLSGMGTTLAMVGAAALAEAIWRRNQLLKMLMTARRLFSR